MQARVIVADDKKYLREILVAILEDVGYEAIAVSTAADAIQALSQIGSDLLVLDMSLAGPNGVEFLHRLRAAPTWRDLPVIFVSGDPAKLCMVEGCANVVTLTKPFDTDALIVAVTNLVGPPPASRSHRT
jgi:CheY-like chemotaxis protein